MVQAHACVSVHCDQCTDAPGGPGFEAHYPDEAAALDAAMAAGWVVARGGRLLCSVCGPVLVCEAEGHQFTGWHRAAPRPGEFPPVCGCESVLRCGACGGDELDNAGAGGVWSCVACGQDTGLSPVHLLGSADCGRRFRYCRRCCVHESRTTPVLGGVA
jgi:hypothetical protein